MGDGGRGISVAVAEGKAANEPKEVMRGLDADWVKQQ